jgi:hypothetical protein
MLIAPERPKGYFSTTIAIFLISLVPCFLLLELLPRGHFFISLLPFVSVFLVQKYLPKFLYNDECQQYKRDMKIYRKEIKKQSALTLDGLQGGDKNNEGKNKHE